MKKPAYRVYPDNRGGTQNAKRLDEDLSRLHNVVLNVAS
jgi:hypothetical protein